jgi:hydroxymethylbilane synthase
MSTQPELRIGTRGSPLALAQAEEVRDRLAAAHESLDADAIAIEVIRTTGDNVQDRPLAEIGGKGLFTKEIEEALFDGRIDLAVHSMKDVATVLPDGLVIASVLPREDPRDAFISPRAADLDALPEGALVGTASLRRQAQVLNRRPDLRVGLIRGNVNTRLRKLEAGDVDATYLALAGLKRLGRAEVATSVPAPEDMLPAVAQGAIGIECRADDARVRDLIGAIDHPTSARRINAERAFLAVLDGSCRMPIAALAEIDAGRLSLVGRLCSPDGTEMFEVRREGAEAEAEALGSDAGHEIRARAGEDFFARLT